MRIRVAFFIMMAAIIVGIGIKQSLSDVDGRKTLPHDPLFLAFGDSLTFGYGASRGESYPARLEEKTGLTVINAGIPGELSEEGLLRLPGLLERYHPAVLLLCHGGNDILQKKDPEKLRANLEAMIHLAQKRRIDVVLIAVPEFALIHMEPHPLYEEIAERHGLIFEPDILTTILHDNRFKSDTIHPNAIGYEMMAEAVAKKVREGYRMEER